MPIDLTKHKPVAAAEIYADLLLISAQLGNGVACMIAARCLSVGLQPGDWHEIKNQLLPENIRMELDKLNSEGGR
jgi:hypothetical protein